MSVVDNKINKIIKFKMEFVILREILRLKARLCPGDFYRSNSRRNQAIISVTITNSKWNLRFRTESCVPKHDLASGISNSRRNQVITFVTITVFISHINRDNFLTRMILFGRCRRPFLRSCTVVAREARE